MNQDPFFYLKFLHAYIFVEILCDLYIKEHNISLSESSVTLQKKIDLCQLTKILSIYEEKENSLNDIQYLGVSWFYNTIDIIGPAELVSNFVK